MTFELTLEDEECGESFGHGVQPCIRSLSHFYSSFHHLEPSPCPKRLYLETRRGAGVGGEGKGRGKPDSWSHSAPGRPVFTDPTGDKMEERRKTTRAREVGPHEQKKDPGLGNQSHLDSTLTWTLVTCVSVGTLFLLFEPPFCHVQI